MTRPRPLIHTPHNLYATFSEENYDEDDDDDDDCFFLLLKSAATTRLTPATVCIASHTYTGDGGREQFYEKYITFV